MSMLKHVLNFIVLMLLSCPAIQAEEGWIDGIKIRFGNLRNRTDIFLPSQETSFINKDDKFSHLNPTPIFPIGIVLPETLMNSWSFRGAVFEFQFELQFLQVTRLLV